LDLQLVRRAASAFAEVNGPITPVIVCGGSGTRLWPISRVSLPKQFLPLFAGGSSFQEAVRRISEPELFGKALIVTHRDYLHMVERQLEVLAVAADILLEPERCGSGPAILAGAMRAAQLRGPDVVVLALAADHVICNVDGFHRACRDGLAAAAAGSIVTFGIAPDHPATGYGYIEPDRSRPGSVLPVLRFVEKPDSTAASSYVSEGYLWNSGNLLFRPSSLEHEYRRHDQATAIAVDEAVMQAEANGNVISLDADAFAGAAHRSIDHAVMERTVRAVAVPASHDWADIGSWEGLHRVLSRKGPLAVISPLRGLSVAPGGTESFTASTPEDEYWIIAAGSGTIVIAGEKKAVRASDFMQIAAGAVCLVENEGGNDLRILAAPSRILSG
jgi:mannose-1-phosphate guanylyltransferase/mannose-6-phosphate isomerase